MILSEHETHTQETFESEFIEALRNKAESDPDVTYELAGNTVEARTVYEYFMQYKATNVSRLKSIPVINQAFIERYGEEFIEKMRYHIDNTQTTMRLSKQSEKVLDMFKDRINNISRNNINLSLSTNSKRHIDLTMLNQPERFVWENRDQIRLTHRSNEDVNDEAIYKNCQFIRSTANRDKTEHGAYNLYMAYPFVQGLYQGEEPFLVRAPLLLHPVRLQKDGVDFVLFKDRERNILLNKDLVFANNKYRSIDEAFEFPEFESMNKTLFFEEVIPFYQRAGVPISKQSLNGFQTNLESFDDLSEEDFEKNDLLHIKNQSVMGIFPIHSSNIQAEIDAILHKNTSNPLIRSLLGSSMSDVKQKREAANYEPLAKGFFYEKEIDYISQLNYAQEKILAESNKQDRLVVWGPPGTGKTQTIQNVIVNAVLRQKNVLVVSSKQVALDVLMSRFQHISDYFLYMVDPNNKAGFYKRIERLFEKRGSPAVFTLDKKKHAIEKDIDKTLNKLRRLKDVYFKHDENGLDLSRLYKHYIPKENRPPSFKTDKVYKVFKDKALVNHDALKMISKTFSNPDKLSQALYFKSDIEPSYINAFKDKENLLIEEDLKPFYTLSEISEATSNKSLIKRFKILRRHKKEHQQLLDYLFDNNKQQKQFLKHIFKNPSFMQWLFENQKAIETSIYVYDHLSKEEKAYLDILYDYTMKHDGDNINHHHHLLNQFYTEYIIQKERKNTRVVKTFDVYRHLVDELKTLTEEKRVIVQEEFSTKLKNNAKLMYNSERFNEISQIVASKKKPTIKQFMKTYGHEIFQGFKVFVMTPEAVSEVFPLEHDLFDEVIYDEASQIYPESAIPSLYRAKGTIVVGDSKQLRPSVFGYTHKVANNFDEEDMLLSLALDAESLLDLARFKYREYVLNYHYRSQSQELIAFSNAVFYKDNLYLSPNAHPSIEPPIKYVYVKNGQWKNRQNYEEAKQIIKKLRDIVFHKKQSNSEKKASIGIITFNSTQRALIEQLIDDATQENSAFAQLLREELSRSSALEDDALFVKNIENVQGNERDIIIFSLGYGFNEDGKFIRNFGALNNLGGENRLNVAITRAKKNIYFFASVMPSQFHTDDLESNGPKLLKRYMEYCFYIHKNNTEMANQVLDSVSEDFSPTFKTSEENFRLIEDIEKNLKMRGYHIIQGTQLRNRLFDIIVQNNTTNQKVGIICDVKTNDKTHQVRNIFYHYEKYLLSNQWRVYRLFGRNWWKKPEQELKSIDALLNESTI